jgi:hypothetical protein
MAIRCIWTECSWLYARTLEWKWNQGKCISESLGEGRFVFEKNNDNIFGSLSENKIDWVSVIAVIKYTFCYTCTISSWSFWQVLWLWWIRTSAFSWTILSLSKSALVLSKSLDNLSRENTKILWQAESIRSPHAQSISMATCAQCWHNGACVVQQRCGGHYWNVCVRNRNTAFKPLNPKLIWIIFKNSVRTAKKTQHFTITKINWLTLFKEIIAVYSENHTKHINAKCRVTGC